MGDQSGGHLLARAGRALPRNLRGGKGSLHSALRADPCRPGEPGVAQRVPDRGDDLTPCHWRAINHGQGRHGAVTHGHTNWQLRHDDGLVRSDSQADSASSILVSSTSREPSASGSPSNSTRQPPTPASSPNRPTARNRAPAALPPARRAGPRRHEARAGPPIPRRRPRAAQCLPRVPHTCHTPRRFTVSRGNSRELASS